MLHGHDLIGKPGAVVNGGIITEREALKVHRARGTPVQRVCKFADITSPLHLFSKTQTYQPTGRAAVCARTNREHPVCHQSQRHADQFRCASAVDPIGHSSRYSIYVIPSVVSTSCCVVYSSIRNSYYQWGHGKSSEHKHRATNCNVIIDTTGILCIQIGERIAKHCFTARPNYRFVGAIPEKKIKDTSHNDCLRLCAK